MPVNPMPISQNPFSNSNFSYVPGQSGVQPGDPGYTPPPIQPTPTMPTGYTPPAGSNAPNAGGLANYYQTNGGSPPTPSTQYPGLIGNPAATALSTPSYPGNGTYSWNGSQWVDPTTGRAVSMTNGAPGNTSTTPGPSGGYSAPATTPTTPYGGQTGGGGQTQPSTGYGSPFGPNPFFANPTENNPLGTQSALNPVFWSSQDTASQLAKLTGGTVSSNNPFNAGSGFSANQPQYMVTLANGVQVNPADIADLYNHGYSQSYINQGLSAYLNNTFPGTTPGTGGMYSVDASGKISFGGGAPSAVPVSNTNQYSPIGYSQLAAGQPLPPGVSLAPGNINGGSGQQFGLPAQTSFAQQTPAAQPPAQSSPFDFGSLVSALYGSNPFAAAFGGNSGLGNMLSAILGGNNASQGGGGGNMLSIATLLNALYSQRSQPTGMLSPLFWGAQNTSLPSASSPLASLINSLGINQNSSNNPLYYGLL